MSITNVSGTITISGAETAANMRTFLASNTTLGSASGNRFTFTAPLSIPSAATLTFNNYSVVDFSDTASLNLVNGGILEMGNYSELRFSGTSKSHSKVDGRINSNNFKYIINATIAGSANRNDFAAANAVFSGANWVVVMDDEAISQTYLHLENAGKTVTGLEIINNKTGGTSYIQFDASTYKNMVIPPQPSGVTQNIYAPRLQSGVCILPNIALKGTATKVFGTGGSSTGSVSIIDPTYPDVASGVPAIQRANLGSSVTSNNSLKEVFTFRANAYTNQTPAFSVAVWNVDTAAQIYNTAFITANAYTHPNGDFVCLAMVNRELANTTVSTSRNKFNIRMRRADSVEYLVSNTSGTTLVETAAPVVDSMFTGTASDAAAITGVAFAVSSGAVTATVTEAKTSQQIYNAWKHWTSQSAQMAGASPVSVSLISITAAGFLSITGSITTSAAVSGAGNATAGISCTGTASTTGSGSYALPVADSAGVEISVTGLNPRNFTLNDAYPASVLYRATGNTGAWTRVSTTTGTSVKFKVTASTSYDLRIRVPGYEWRALTVASGASGAAVAADLSATLALNGDALFSISGTQALMDAIVYDGANTRLTVSNTTAAKIDIDFQSAYLKFIRILHDPTLISAWENQLKVNSARNGFLIPTGNPTTVALTSGSTANVFLNFTVQHEADSSFSFDRFKGNASGYQISFATQVNQLSVPIPSANDNATAAVNAIKAESTLPKVSDIPTAVQIKTAVDGSTVLAKATEVSKLTGLLTTDNTKFTTTALSNGPTASLSGSTVTIDSSAIAKGVWEYTTRALTSSTAAGLTDAQAAQLARIHNTAIAHSFTLQSAIAQGASFIPLTGFAQGYFEGHYIVINDGSGSPIQRHITSHNTNGINLNAPINAVATGQVVNILIRTTDQDGPDVTKITQGMERTGTALDIVTQSLVCHSYTISGAPIGSATTIVPADSAWQGHSFAGHYIIIPTGDGEYESRVVAEHVVGGDITLDASVSYINNNRPVIILHRTTKQDAPSVTDIANAVQDAIINETDGKKVVDAIVKAVSTSGLTESAIATAVRTDIERTGGKLDKAMKAAQAADDQTV